MSTYCFSLKLCINRDTIQTNCSLFIPVCTDKNCCHTWWEADAWLQMEDIPASSLLPQAPSCPSFCPTSEQFQLFDTLFSLYVKYPHLGWPLSQNPSSAPERIKIDWMISQQTTLHSAGGSHNIRSGYSRSVFSHTGGVALLELRSLLKPIFLSELRTSKTAPNTARPPPTAPKGPKVQVLASQFGTKGIFDIWAKPVIHLIHTQSSSSVVASYLTLL